MCLIIDDTLTKQYIKRNIKKKKVIVWKCIEINSDKTMCSPYIGAKINFGWYKAQGKALCLYDDIYCRAVYRKGVIHVYRTRNAARSDGMGKVFKCYAYMKDFISAGQDEDLAFTKIFIPKREL